MQTTRQLKYEPDPNKFDLRTHVWDAQGNLVSENLYRSFIIEGRQYFERPVNSGNLWFENNQPAGRVDLEFNEKGHIKNKTFHFDAPHKAYTAPLTGAEKLHFELEQQREENAALKAELEQIKAEKEKKALHSVHEGFPNADLDEEPKVQASETKRSAKNTKTN